MADAYKRDGFNVRSIATHKMILRLDSQNEEAMRNLAELQAEEGLLMEAKSHYQTLVELYTKQGHKRRASEVFKKLAEIDPQDVKIRYKYAEFLSKQGKSDEASREYVGIADQFIGQGLVDEAVKILEQGRSLDASNPALKIKLAHAHTLQGNHAQAVRMLEEVRLSHPADPNVLGQLGEAYLAAGNTAEAETAFQQLNEAEPGNPDNVMRLRHLRATALSMQGRREEAEVLWREVLEWQREHLLSDADPRTYAPTRDTWGPLVIPPDHYFMLGDNREKSLDSRYWGLLEAWRLEGRALFTYFSYNKGSYRPFPAIREVRWGRVARGIH